MFYEIASSASGLLAMTDMTLCKGLAQGTRKKFCLMPYVLCLAPCTLYLLPFLKEITKPAFHALGYFSKKIAVAAFETSFGTMASAI